MLHPSNNRRRFLSQSASLGAAGAIAGAGLLCGNTPLAAQENQTEVSKDVAESMPAPAFRYCLNTSSINGSKVPVRKQLKVAAEAGYDAVELWLRDVEKFLSEGGTTADLAKELRDLGLGVDSAIAFGDWISDDDEKRKAGLEQAKHDMEIIAALGGTHIAAPPIGARTAPLQNILAVPQRYRELLEIGAALGVTPQVELWGFAANLSTLGEVLLVAANANHPDACVLLDVYHMYKGGSDFSNIGLVPGTRMHCLHMNDYPAEPNRENIGDQDRVYPGDGVAPMNDILRTLAAGGFDGTLSLELFNRSYWESPASEVAKIGLDKMKSCVERAFA